MRYTYCARVHRRQKVKKIISYIIVILTLCVFTSCNQADNIQHNISKSSDAFETYREVTIINLRTDKVLMQIEGYISIKNSSSDELAIIIKTGPSEYKMHYVYLGGEMIYLVEQKENTYTDGYHWDIRIFAEFPRIITE